LLEATSSLYLELITKDDSDIPQKSYIQHCESLAFRLGPIWIADILAMFHKNPDHDVAIRCVFQTLVRGVGDELSLALGPQDLSTVRARLGDLRLYLPSDIVSPRMPVPNATKNFILNVLTVREWRLVNQRYRPPIPVRNAVSSLFSLKASVESDAVVVSIYVYGTLNITRDTEPLAPMSVVGVALADALWQYVFDTRTTWNTKVRKALRELHRCGSSPEVDEGSHRLQFAPLSLKVCVRASRGDQWHSLFYGWGGMWKLSRSQIFYMMTVFHFFCHPKSEDPEARVREMRSLISGASEDFGTAFGCPSDPRNN
ncbi:unnamed protein product, partial [Ixodes hexagonus]